MSIVVRFKPTSLTAATYDESTRQLETAGVDPRPDGLDRHICFGTDGDLQVIEIWDSHEQFEAFGQRLGQLPVLAEARHRVLRATGDPRRPQDRQARSRYRLLGSAPCKGARCFDHDGSEEVAMLGMKLHRHDRRQEPRSGSRLLRGEGLEVARELPRASPTEPEARSSSSTRPDMPARTRRRV